MSDNIEKQTENSAFNPNLETVCPSCGRFTGVYEKCPYCGRSVYKRLSIRLIKVAALFMAFTGLFFLYYASISRELPVIKIAEVKPSMNFAYVTVKGVATSDASINTWGGLFFTVNDSADGKDIRSNVSIRAYNDMTNHLKERNLLPAAGDRVEISGSLKVSEGGISLIIQSPDQVKVFPKESREMLLDDITEANLNEKVRIHVSVLSITETPGKAPNEIRVSDNSGNASLTVWKTTCDELVKLPGFATGAMLKADVVVDSYRGKLQLWIKNSRNVTVMMSSQSPLTVSTEKTFKEPFIPENIQKYQASEINSSLIGKTISVSGKINEIQESSGKAPSRLVFEDSTGTMELFCWGAVFEKLKNLPGFTLGTLFTATVKAGEYKDKLQLFIDKPHDFQISGDVLVHEIEPQETALDQISSELLGRQVITSGTIMSSEGFGKGNFKAVLSDNNNSVDLIFWSRSFSSLPSCIISGAKLRVRGSVNKYQERLQLYVDSESDLEVLQ